MFRRRGGISISAGGLLAQPGRIRRLVNNQYGACLPASAAIGGLAGWLA